MNTREVLAWLEKKGTRRTREGQARFAIVAERAFGVSTPELKTLARQLGKDHHLARELWDSGWFEARLLAALVGEPERVTRREMNAWAAGFENWADCDTVCCKLWDRSPFAWTEARRWARSPRELVKRGGFALMAGLAVHEKDAPDARFLAFLPLIEHGARDGRNFVKKGVSWALRGIGKRSPGLNAAALPVAKRLAGAEESAARWVGRDALRELSSAKVQSRLVRRAAAAARRRAAHPRRKP